MDPALNDSKLVLLTRTYTQVDPLDPAIIDMIGEPTATIYSGAPNLILALAVELSAERRAAAILKQQHGELEEAIHKYAVESGAGEIFLQNLKICITQIRAGFKPPGRI